MAVVVGALSEALAVVSVGVAAQAIATAGVGEKRRPKLRSGSAKGNNAIQSEIGR